MLESTRVKADHEPDVWTLMSDTKRGRFCFGGAFPVSPLEVEGLTSAPELFTNYQRLISRDGMWKGTQYLGGRTITLSMNILAKGQHMINNVVNELGWAFPIGYGTDQEEIDLHFRIPGIANGGAAKVTGMVKRRDIKLDRQYAVNGAARINIEVYCSDPKIYGYGRARSRIDTASGFFNGGVRSPFPFTVDGLTFPENWSPGVENKVLVTNNSKDKGDDGLEFGPDWETEIFGPISNPKVVRRNYFEDWWTISFKEDVHLQAGMKLVYKRLPRTGNTDASLKYSGTITLVDGKTETKLTPIATYKDQPDPNGHAWKLIGNLRTDQHQISTSEYWSILPGDSRSPIEGNAHGYVTWWGGEFI